MSAYFDVIALYLYFQEVTDVLINWLVSKAVTIIFPRKPFKMSMLASMSRQSDGLQELRDLLFKLQSSKKISGEGCAWYHAYTDWDYQSLLDLGVLQDVLRTLSVNQERPQRQPKPKNHLGTCFFNSKTQNNNKIQ